MQQAVVKRRKISVYLGSLSQNDKNRLNKIPARGRVDRDDDQLSTLPASSSNATFATNFAAIDQTSNFLKQSARLSNEMATPILLNEPTIDVICTKKIGEQKSGSAPMDTSFSEFSMDSDVFASIITKNMTKSTPNLEDDFFSVPEISEDVRVLQRQFLLETKSKSRDETNVLSVIEPLPTVQKEIIIYLKRRNDSVLNSVHAYSGLSNENGNILKCGRICGKREHLGICWELILKAGITLLEANHAWTLAACENCELAIIRTKSGKLCKTLRFNSHLAAILLYESVCLVILANSKIITWNLETGKTIVQNSLAVNFYNSDVKILEYAITDAGIPMLLLSNGECVVYSKEMGAWMSVNVGVDSISKFIESIKFIVKIAPNGLLALLSKQPTSSSEKANLDEDISSSCEETQLEALMAACEAIESWVELRFIFGIYTQKLLKRRKQAKLVESLEELSNNLAKSGEFKKLLEHIKPILHEYGTTYEDFIQQKSEVRMNISFID